MLRTVLRRQAESLPPYVPHVLHDDLKVIPRLDEIAEPKHAWQEFFDEQTRVTVGTDEFAVYQSFCRTVDHSFPTFFLIHGAGHTALSWALLIPSLRLKARVIALDLRGHGLTRCHDSTDLSLDTLVNDCAAVLQQLQPIHNPSQSAAEHEHERLSRVVVVGHSMGGAVATHLCASKKLAVTVGLVVIDVVEGTALTSLLRIKSILEARPTEFPSCAHAIRWALLAQMPKNSDAASISIPAQLVHVPFVSPLQITDNHPTDLSSSSSSSSAAAASSSSSMSMSSPCDALPVPVEAVSESTGGCWQWRIDLLATERFWKGWYQGMSEVFLRCSAQKLLILAGTDRLDTPLLIGQMQGKFQVQVLPEAGHCVQEDQPHLTAHHLLTFIDRFQL